MSKNRVFIWGSCVSRDTFEHFSPDEFELIHYVARQSALSAYTRPVDLVDPPRLESPFQQRTIIGDFTSDLLPKISQAGSNVDLLLVDLADERLGVYLLPDGSVITRTVDLIRSGSESQLPVGTQYIPFGTAQHLQYWTAGIQTVGDFVRQAMPRAGVALLDIPWAEVSETGELAPDSYGLTAQEANTLYRPYIEVGARTLDAQVIALSPSEVASSPRNPWGEAPFHYSENVYIEIVRRLTGTNGRVVWGHDTGASSPEETTPRATLPVADALPDSADRPPAQSESPLGPQRVSAAAPVKKAAPRVDTISKDASAPPPRLEGGPNFLIAGASRSGTTWLQTQLGYHPDIFMASRKASNFFNFAKKHASTQETAKYLAEFKAGEDVRWRGERSVLYFWHSAEDEFSPKREDTAATVRDRLDPDAPILLSLRDPVSRAVSSFWNYRSNGEFPLSTTIFETPREKGIIDLGYYRRHYEHWARTLGADRLHVLLYDDLVKDPAAYLKSALGALGASDSPELWKKATLKKRENHKPWLAPIRKANPISRGELAALLELYRDDIEFIEDLTNRNLAGWRDLRRLASTVNPK